MSIVIKYYGKVGLVLYLCSLFYFWINDFTPTMIMHPIKPALNGKNLSSMKDPTGKHLFNEMVDVANKKGKGVVNYMWSKPGFDKPQQKISYIPYHRQ
mgnify:CR=1 FL=1